MRARITGMRLATASAGLFTLVATLAAAAPASAAPASPRTAAATGVRYVALGDSYASGLGTGREQGNCDRSPAAYGPQWARAHQPASFTFAACSGATARGIRTHRLSALSPATTLSRSPSAATTSASATCSRPALSGPPTTACRPSTGPSTR